MLETLYFRIYSKLILRHHKLELIHEKGPSGSTLMHSDDEYKSNHDPVNTWLLVKDNQVTGSFILNSICENWNSNTPLNYQINAKKTVLLKVVKVNSTDSIVLNHAHNLIFLKIFTYMNKIGKNRIIITGSDYCLKKIHRLGIKTKLVFSKSHFTHLAIKSQIKHKESTNTHVVKLSSNRLHKAIWKLIWKEFKANLPNIKYKRSNYILSSK